MAYTDVDRRQDFDYFISVYQSLFEQYGHKFIAIKNKKILGKYDSIREAIINLSPVYDVGTYIIQECTGDESGYTTFIMGLLIGG